MLVEKGKGSLNPCLEENRTRLKCRWRCLNGQFWLKNAALSNETEMALGCWFSVPGRDWRRQKMHSHKMKLPLQGDAVILSKLGGFFYLQEGNSWVITLRNGHRVLWLSNSFIIAIFNWFCLLWSVLNTGSCTGVQRSFFPSKTLSSLSLWKSWELAPAPLTKPPWAAPSC